MDQKACSFSPHMRGVWEKPNGTGGKGMVDGCAIETEVGWEVAPIRCSWETTNGDRQARSTIYFFSELLSS